jgi:ribosome-associated protein
MAAPPKFPVDEREVEFSAIRAQGAGGQNVNKVSSAIHLRFDIHASSLPDAIKERLLCLSDSRITQEGVLVLKAQQHRTQEMNRADALARLQEVVDGVSSPPKARRATKPTYGSKQRRLEGKQRRVHHGAVQHHAPVQVRPRHAAGGAHFAPRRTSASKEQRRIAGFEHVAGLHVGRAQVAHHAQQARRRGPATPCCR